MSDYCAAPFPWFGGKSKVAEVVWQAFGDVSNYVEPFFGSGAVLLRRPTPFDGTETVNDADGLLSNFWRAVSKDPESVAAYADWPVNEADLHARHLWLIGQRDGLTERLMSNEEFFDAKVAGWWVWGACCWIGGSWCSGEGPWVSDGEGLIHRQVPHLGNAGMGIHRKVPHLGDAGRGIHRQVPHLGNAGMGIHRQVPHLGNAGRGIHRQVPHLGSAGRGILNWFSRLSDRLRRVRVACGDWTRVCGPSVTFRHGTTALFLDPPYEFGSISYAAEREQSVSHKDIVAWAEEMGRRDDMRIAYCGYEGGLHPSGWRSYRWKAHGGYGSQGHNEGRENSMKETIWFSPSCLGNQSQMSLWGG